MDVKEFKKYTNNLDAYTAGEVDEFEPMTDEELDEYQRELEFDTGNLSDWDHIRAIITLKKRIADLS
jgi:hypothetical protein